MRLCAAQIQPTAGDITANLSLHRAAIERALALGAELIVFPELSLTGYEPTLAADLAMTADDSRLGPFQALAEERGPTIAVGLPLQAESGVEIGQVWFQPGAPRLTYSKMLLHVDELPYFRSGTRQVLLRQSGHVLAPAICYESLQPEHAEAAAGAWADVYLASVAKSVGGVDRAFVHYPAIARQHGMAVLMANSIGPCDNFVAAGRSAIWSPRGQLVAQLDADAQGVLVFDTETGAAERTTW
jgi:predicted amidohydrolase